MKEVEEKVQHKVMIVDDNERNRQILIKILEKDYQLEMAENGEEALEKLDSSKPAVVLLDIMMPGIDGYEVCRSIRSQEKYSGVKIIMVSGKAMVEERLEGYKAGANDYLTKPFDHMELKAKVRVYCQLFETERRLREINESLEEEVQMRTDQLLQSERMAMLGMNVAQIIHNLKNPLSMISFYTSKFQKKYPEDPHMEKFSYAIERLGETIKTVLTTATDSINVNKEDVDLNEILKNEAELLRGICTQMKYNTDIVFEFSELPKLSGVPVHLSQVFGNLMKNALDAMHDVENGVLKIATRSSESGMIVSITDNGCGIAPEDLEKVFEPLYSTKLRKTEGDQPQGSGLGMPFVKKMVEAYSGAIKISSEVGKGTTVSVYFPLRGSTQSKGSSSTFAA